MPSKAAQEAIKTVKMKVVKPNRLAGELVLRWTDPSTGRPRERRTGTKTRREAWQMAADLAFDIAAGQTQDAISWEEFCQLYKLEHLVKRADKTAEAWASVEYWIDQYRRPRHLYEIDDRYVVMLQSRMSQGGLAAASIAAYSTRLRAGLNWARKRKLLAAVPDIEVGEFRARGRPLVGEEWERMLAVVHKVRPRDTELWVWFITGIYWSGLRLGEIWQLSWEADARVRLDGAGEFPLIWISPKGQKSGRDDIQPIPDEFWQVCLEASGDRREGYVFPLPAGRNGNPRMNVKRCSKVISDIGRAAGIKVDPDTGKSASAHDLRRSFACLMDDRLTITELQKTMRHKDIRTTIKYYARKQATEIARKMRRAPGGALGGAPKSPPEHDEIEANPKT